MDIGACGDVLGGGGGWGVGGEGGGGLKGISFFHCQQNSDFKLRIKIPETSTVFNSESIVCMLN